MSSYHDSRIDNDSTEHPITKSRENHGTGVSDSGRWSTKRIAIYALFVALTMISSFISFPLMPAVAPWLKYDPSGIVCLMAAFAFGPAAATIVSVLGFLPHIFTDQWGTLVAILVSLSLSVPAALVYRHMRTRLGAALGMTAGAICALVAAIVANVLITPIYAQLTVAQVVAMIIPILLPFNLIKFAIHAVVTFLIYKPISAVLYE